MKFILIGCGLLTGLFILGMGSCGGVMYLAYKSTDPVADVGAEYLRHSELQRVGGIRIDRKAFGWNVNIHNDSGNARIAYTVKTPEGGPIGEAVVWLVRTGGKWEAVGARVKGDSGKEETIGKPPSEHHLKWDD